MDGRAKRVLVILAVALVLGVLADALIRVGPWGINGTIWVAAFVLALWGLQARDAARLPAGRRAFLPLALLFGACLAWRDSITLKLLDVLVMAAVFTICVLPSRVVRLRELALTHGVMAGVDAARNMAFGLLAMLFHDVPAKAPIPGAEGPKTGRDRSRQAKAVLLGVVLTIPLVFVFGSLFMSADPAFKAIVDRLFNGDLFNLDWERLADHLIPIGACTWSVAGYLRLLLLKTELPWPREDSAKAIALNALTLAVPLVSLDLLFLSFVAVQGSYMFGGEELIRNLTGLTYSAYAREGFFQLVAVAILALGVLLVVDWLARDEAPVGKRVLRATGGALVALVYVVLASALYRMRLYQDVYGFTELRVYTTAFMLWLAIVFFWFLATVLRGRREHFALGAVITGMAVVFGLHVFNPDAYIVRANYSRVALGKSFDAEYAASLSADAAPALSDILPSLDHAARNTLAPRLREWAASDRQSDWRTWSWSRHRAAALQAVEPGENTRS